MPGYEVIDDREKNAVLEIFEKSNGVLFAHGFNGLRNGIFKVRQFEKEFSDKFSQTYTQAVSSGTAALKTALKSLDIGPGDEVITQAFTFVATVEAILDCGATPVIVDVDKSLNMSPNKLREAITPKTKCAIPVHMMGNPCDMNEISIICKDAGIAIIEDTAQACGGRYKGKYLGTFGNLGAFSFDYGKIITSGEGGMVITSDYDLYIKARAYHDHGHAYNTEGIPRGKEPGLLPGWNYRMNEMNAAVGIVQLEKLEGIISGMRKNKALMYSILSEKSEEFDLGIEFRQVNDTEEVAESLIFFVESKERALKIAEHIYANDYSTKNLPDAFQWHFAGCWEHLFENHPEYSGVLPDQWSQTRDLLERAIALPVQNIDTPETIASAMQIVVEALENN